MQVYEDNIIFWKRKFIVYNIKKVIHMIIWNTGIYVIYF